MAQSNARAGAEIYDQWLLTWPHWTMSWCGNREDS